MHSAFTRSHALAAYTVSVLAALTFICFGTTAFRDYNTTATINTVTVVVYVPF